MSVTISSILVKCLGHLKRLLSSGSLAPYDSEVRQDLWQDELGRLRVWASNIGAHQTGQLSLDFRLRDASHIKDQTVKLLQGLQRTLNNLDEVLADPAPDEGEIDSEDDEDGTELQQIYKGLVDNITCLFKMSMAIRRPAQHDRLLGTKRADAASFEPFDRQHVSNKYPKADSAVIDRLGAAISRRRAGLKYRERHHEKLKQGINRILPDQPDTVSTKLSETIVTEYDEICSAFEDTASNSGVSQTSYAQTLLQGQDAMTIPPPPKESADGAAFECPYCYFIITVNSRRSWARHIFHDIMPYTCVFPDCSTPNRLYDSRREWSRHLLNVHSVSCTPGAKIDCPLCKDPVLSGRLFERHLGRHLEELALFAMPRTEVDDDADSKALAWSHKEANTLDGDVLDRFSGTDSDDDDDNNDGGPESSSDPASDPLPEMSTAAETDTEETTNAELLAQIEKLVESRGVEVEREIREALGRRLTGNMEDPAERAQEERIAELVAKLKNETGQKGGNMAEHEADVGPMFSDEEISRDSTYTVSQLQSMLRDLKEGKQKAQPTDLTESATNIAAAALMPEPEKKLIRFVDAFGRQFIFPFHICRTWKGMEDLIMHTFRDTEILNPGVAEGHYDLADPDGNIIPPQAWESVIQPDWKITMIPRDSPENRRGIGRVNERIERARTDRFGEKEHSNNQGIENDEKVGKKGEETHQREMSPALQRWLNVRSSMSCDLCYSRKAHCEQSEKNPDACKRCSRERKECTFARTRKNRKPNSAAGLQAEPRSCIPKLRAKAIQEGGELEKETDVASRVEGVQARSKDVHQKEEERRQKQALEQSTNAPAASNTGIYGNRDASKFPTVNDPEPRREMLVKALDILSSPETEKAKGGEGDQTNREFEEQVKLENAATEHPKTYLETVASRVSGAKVIIQETKRQGEADQEFKPPSSSSPNTPQLGKKEPSTKPNEEQEAVSTEDNAQMMNLAEIWDRLESTEEFRNGEINFDDLCAELQTNARCSESGVVVDQKDVDDIISRAK